MRLLLSVTAFLTTTAVAMASPQGSASTVPNPTPGKRPVQTVINGAQNPELIELETVAVLVLGGFAASGEMLERRIELLAEMIGLGGNDRKLLRQELIRLSETGAPIRERLNTPNPAPGTLEEFREVRLNTYGRLLELLSEGGNKRLRKFLEEQKRNVRVSGSRSPVRD